MDTMIVLRTFKDSRGKVVAAVGSEEHVHQYADLLNLEPHVTRYVFADDVVAVLPQYDAAAQDARAKLRAKNKARHARWHEMRPRPAMPLPRTLKGRRGETGAPFGTGAEARLLPLSR